MVVALNSEQTRLVDQAVQAGLIRGVEDVVDFGLATLREQLASNRTQEPMTAEEWSRRLDAWIASHPTDTPLLSDEAISRESIYEDHGL